MDMDVLQRRTVRTLVAAQVLGGLGVGSGLAVGSLLVEELSGSTVLAGLALAASGCGGDERPADQGVGAGNALRLADCEDWNDSAVEERLATVTQLREFAGGPVGETPGRGAILDDDEAYDLLERHCDAEFADAFKLYKIYVRAAAFIGH